MAPPPWVMYRELIILHDLVAVSMAFLDRVSVKAQIILTSNLPMATAANIKANNCFDVIEVDGVVVVDLQVQHTMYGEFFR